MGIDSTTIGDFLKLLEIIAIFGTGSVVVYKIGRTTERFEMLGAQQAREIKELKDTMKEFAQVQIRAVTDRAVLNSHATLIAEMRVEINRLKEGKGFIQSRIDGQYP